MVVSLRMVVLQGINSLAGDITTVNTDINFATAVALMGPVALNTDTAIGDIIFQSTVDGAIALDLTAGTGNIDFEALVGGSTPITSITINSATNVGLDAAVTAGTFTQMAGTGITTIDGVLTTTVGDVSINTNQIDQNANICICR